MRSRYSFGAAAIALSLLFFVRGAAVSRADSPTPTPKPTTRSSSRVQNQYYYYFPLILDAPALKKGVALTYNDCPSVTALNSSWEYAWLATPPNCASVENVPMIWGAANVNWTLGGNSQWVMGFNEPDSASQANISPSNAAQLWRQIEQKYPNRKLLAPAPSGANANWIVDFRTAYISAYGVPPRLDGLAAHCFDWYASACISQGQQFITWANSWGVPEVWVTEFSFSPNDPSNPTQALQEEQTFINWMVSQPKITRYTWFASKMQGNEWWAIPQFITPLVDYNTGQPTSFGNIYLPYH